MVNIIKKNEQKRSNGITLIALVITIIILLILAGITITGLTGEKGIIKEAKTAKELTELAELEEQVELSIIKAEQKYRNPTIDEVITELINNKVISDESQVIKKTGEIHTDAGYLIEGKLNDYIGNITENNTTGGGDMPTQPEVDERWQIVTGDENKTYTKNGTAVIPVGFAIVPGLDDVSEGLVISDVANDTENTGNQFVWIPVINSVSYERNITYEFTFLSEVAYDDTEYLPDGITNEEDAVRSAGGFYVSRYEAGQNGTDTLVSKKGATIWENVSPTTAKTIAKTIFTDNTHVKSALISGIQWDMTMAFISSKPRLDGTNKTYDVTKTDNSRHIGGSSVTIAGDNEADKVCNIYDLEGNAYECVAEKNTAYKQAPFIVRGGYYKEDGRPASNRGYTDEFAYESYSFRIALYVM